MITLKLDIPHTVIGYVSLPDRKFVAIERHDGGFHAFATFQMLDDARVIAGNPCHERFEALRDLHDRAAREARRYE